MNGLSPEQASVMACIRALEAEGVRVSPKAVAVRVKKSLSSTQAKMGALRDKGLVKLERSFNSAKWSSIPGAVLKPAPARAAPVPRSKKPTHLPRFKQMTVAPQPTGPVPDARLYLMRRHDAVWTADDGRHCVNGRVYLTDDELITYVDAARDRDARAARLARRAA